MKYGRLPGLDKPVSRVVQGTMMVNTDQRDYSFALLDAAVARGVNTFDLAHVYGGGGTERCFGQWLADRGNRDQVVILDKGAHPNADRPRVRPYDILSDLHDSLARLGTDCIDIYVLHRDDPSLPVGPIVETLNEIRREGKIRVLGASNWRHERIEQANRHAAERDLAGFVVSSPNYSLARQVEPPWAGGVSLGGPENLPARQWYARSGLAVFSWSSLASGFFSGRFTRANRQGLSDSWENLVKRCYCCEDNFTRLDRAADLAGRNGLTVPQVAAAFILNQPMNMFGVFGCRSAEEVDQIARAADVALSPAELDWLDLK
ncbi:MAG TPA: aldo/keto reductase [Phycisphaerae bacterium]|nr:aldo/keto reductase [Phycisphaerae bacterium]